MLRERECAADLCVDQARAERQRSTELAIALLRVEMSHWKAEVCQGCMYMRMMHHDSPQRTCFSRHQRGGIKASQGSNVSNNL